MSLDYFLDLLDNSSGEFGVTMFVLCVCSVVSRVCSPLLNDVDRIIIIIIIMILATRPTQDVLYAKYISTQFHFPL